jgi:hypothetical protein
MRPIVLYLDSWNLLLYLILEYGAGSSLPGQLKNETGAADLGRDLFIQELDVILQVIDIRQLFILSIILDWRIPEACHDFDVYRSML